MTNTNEQELKPCPFCGNGAIAEHSRERMFHVACTYPDCEASVDYFNSLHLAIEAWNTRAPASPVQEGLRERFAHDVGFTESEYDLTRNVTIGSVLAWLGSLPASPVQEEGDECSMAPRNAGIDHCIQDIINELNKAGFETIASCCGHGFQPMRISLDSGAEILILNYKQAQKVATLFPGINGEQAHPTEPAQEAGEECNNGNHTWLNKVCRDCGKPVRWPSTPPAVGGVKPDRKHLNKQVEEVIGEGIMEGEAADVTTRKMVDLIWPLIQYQSERRALSSRAAVDVARFLEIHSGLYGEDVDSLEQMTMQRFTGEELYHYVKELIAALSPDGTSTDSASGISLQADESKEKKG